MMKYLLVGVAVLLLCTSNAVAQPDFSPFAGIPASEKGEIARRVAEELDLTAEQKKEMKSLRLKQKELRELSWELKEEQKLLGQLLKSLESEPASVRRHLKSVNEKVVKLNTGRVEGFLKLKSVLNKQQQRKLRKFIHNRKAKLKQSGADRPGAQKRWGQQKSSQQLRPQQQRSQQHKPQGRTALGES